MSVVESVRGFELGFSGRRCEAPHAPEGDGTDTECEILITHMPHSEPSCTFLQRG
ncbi:hypothetical protein GCM10010273_55750 [Streptomyces lavendulocolor]